jgi:YbbR domain-containing protein
MRRFLRKYILANAALKLLALGISFLLWTTYTSEPVSEVGFQVPLEFISMPARLEISGDVPTSVHVRLRGRSALLRRMVAADLNLRVDLKNGKEGASQIRVTPDMVGTPYGATVVQVSPAAFQVTLVPHHEIAPPAG